MPDRQTATSQHKPAGSARKDLEEWTTGDEPMTGAQYSDVRTPYDGAGEPMDATLTEAQVAQRINALQQKAGRGVGTHRPPGPCPARQGSPDPDAAGDTRKDPEEWSAGGDPMTAARRSYLKTFSDEAGDTPDATPTTTQASARLEALQRHTGRGAAAQERPC